MHRANPAKLSSIIAKQIRLKHLNSGILHTQTRNRYRNYKLKQHYQTPSAASGHLVMYSNPQGNQFIFKKSHFDAADFPQPLEVYQELTELQRDINEDVYELWRKWKSMSTREYFPLSRQLLVWSMVGLWSLALLLCLVSSLLGSGGYSQNVIQWAIIASIVVVVLINLGVFMSSITSKYSCFEYDNEVAKLVAKKIRVAQDKLKDYGVDITCDREITWISFKITSQSTKKQAEIDEMMEE